ncbi:InlB B-repeat-containing protein [Brumimicrobium aurantiacum]|uniref:T9SS C-terminal target domain-containing protein n=1 Tax=Brumimicrobium aurantiacum TaxID=1737063 RepID=A0A3E1EY73_9FLAO|nr:InlB B-repeat-containing protein [Brumimicrobium aurantiacum]RFC54510.1 T9SS C-terminal target domain-containing protein [Brumimicrobium aurantiacum]
MFFNVKKSKFANVLLVLLTVVFGWSNAWGQTTIAKNSFETSGDTWTPITFSVSPCTNGSDRWDYSTNLSSISPSDGSQFWGIQDLNGNCGGSGFETITFPSLNVSAYTNVEISFDYYTIGFDGTDEVGYEIWEDGVRVVNSTSLNKNTGSWITETHNVTNGVSDAYLVLKVQQDGGSDYAGFDNVEVIGTSAGPTLITTPTSLTDLNYVVGNGPSAVQSFDLTGANLDGTTDVELLAGTGFEISTNNSTFSGSLNLGASTSLSQTIYVRLESGLGVGSYSDIVWIYGGGATDVEVDLEGEVWLTAPPLVYCTSSASNNWSQHISNVEFGTIDFGAGSNGYENNTSISTNVTVGQIYTLTVENGAPYNNEEISVWIDWNQNGDFTDAGEKVVNQLYAGNFLTNTDINIPLTAGIGSTRMRISMHNSGSITSCESYNYGEVEDYTVNVVPASPTLDVSPTSLSGLDYTFGSGPSTVQSFELTGSNLDGTDVELITIIDDCEISLSNNSGFGHYLNLPAYNGNATTIYVRLKAGLMVDSYIDQVLISGGGVAAANEPEVDLEGEVTPTPYDVIFDANGGAGTMANQTIISGATENLDANTFTRSGYVFDGWSTTSSGTVDYMDGAAYTMGNNDVTLYALWSVYTGPCFAMNTPDFTGSSGYTGSGDPDSGGSPTSTVRLASGSNPGSISTTATGVTSGDISVEFRAKGWDSNELQVTVTVDGTSQFISNLNYNAFETRTLSFTGVSANPVIEFSTVSGKRVHIGNVEIYCLVASPTLTTSPASLTGLNYVVGNGPSTVQSFDLTGSNLDGTTDVELLAGTGFEISTNNSNFSGSLNLGASTSLSQTIYVRLESGLGVGSYSDIVWIYGGGATDVEVDLEGEVTPTPYDVIFDANGGTGTMANQTITSGATENLDANTFTRSGYVFDGWSTTSSGTVDFTDGAAYTMGNSDVTLYAVWSVYTGPCLEDDFNSGYGNWTEGSGTYNNNNAGYSGNGIGFNDNNDDIITASTMTNPQSISFNCSATSSANYTILIQYSTSVSGPWTTSASLSANGSNTGDITTSNSFKNISLNLNGDYYLRIIQTPRSGGSFYLDDVEVYCGPTTPSCTSTASITSFMPTSGPAESLVTISGSGFTGASAVKFGSASALSFTIIDDNTIVAEVPSGLSPTVDVFVSDASSCDAQGSSSFTFIEYDGTCGNYPGYTDLFISEVYDSDSNNEWLVELFNPTPNAITLNGVYEVKRAGDISSSPSYSRTITLTGTVAANSTYTLNIGTSSSCSGSYDFSESGAGINEEDMITLFKNGTLVDVVHAPDDIGYSLLRNVGTSVVAPSDTYIASDWTANNSESCSDLGTYNLTITPAISLTSGPTDVTSCSVSMSVVSSTSGVSYKWMYNDPSNMAGWSEVNASNINVGTISGETSANLTISGDVSSLIDFQFYCEVSNGTCDLASNSAQFDVDSKPIYRSVVSANGNWSDYTNWEMSTNYTTYTAACTYPRDFNSDEVIIQDGTTIVYDLTGADEITINKVTIEAGGTLELSASSHLTIEGNTANADLIVKGTLFDRTNSSHSLSLTSGTTWEINSSGTFIKSNAGAIAFYRDQYEGGMSSIPAGATWIYRYNGDGNPSVGAVNFFYPNLIFENTTGSTYSWNTVGNLFDGSTGGYTTVKGNFDIGVSGNAGCEVAIVNFNSQPMLIHGDLFIEAGSKLINKNSSASTFGTGVELKGNLTVNGELNILNGSTERVLKFSGSADQSVSGSGVLNLYKVDVNKSGGSMMIHKDFHVQNELVMNNSNIYLNGNLIELGLSTTQKGTLTYTTGYVVGKMRRWFDGTNAGNASSLFPIGSNDSGLKNRNAKIEFTNAPSNGGYLTVEFINSPMTYDGLPISSTNSGGAGFDITTAEDQGFWKMENESGKLDDGQYTITLNGEGFTTVNNLNQLTLLKRVVTNSPDWFCPGNHVSPTGSVSNPIVARSGVTGWSNFGFGGGVVNPLPITLSSFNVICNEMNEITEIQWTTASESNSSHFIVEKSTDFINWNKVETIAAAGNSDQFNHYNVLDRSGVGGINYYQLIQYDFDGEYEVFSPISSECNFNSNSINIYPNPTDGVVIIQVDWKSKSKYSLYELTDATGRIIALNETMLKQGKNEINLDCSLYSAGVYTITFPQSNLKPQKLIVK